MAFLNLHNNRPTSPGAGFLPDDPHYKLRREAEIRAAAEPATSSIDKASLYLGLSQVNGVLDEANNALDAVVPREKREEISWVSRQMAELSSAISLTKPVVQSRVVAQPRAQEPPTVDQAVVIHQEEAEAWLRTNCPDAREEISLASERFVEAGDAIGNRQAGLLAQGLESLRRVLRMLADHVAPAREGGDVDRSGKECRTDLGGYVSRLHLALDGLRDENGLFEYDKAELDLFHRRMVRLNDRLGSGVHGSADYEEARQLYSDVWRMVAVYRRTGL